VLFRSFLAIDLPGAPFQPAHLTQALLGIAAIADAVARDLTEVIDGERAALAN
jgi:hypothetical protein